MANMANRPPGAKHHGKPTPSPTATPAPTPPSVTLAWEPSAGAAGYHLWLGFSPGGENQPTDTGGATTWTLQLSPATTYYFVVTAYDSAGESLPSNEVSYRTP